MPMVRIVMMFCALLIGWGPVSMTAAHEGPGHAHVHGEECDHGPHCPAGAGPVHIDDCPACAAMEVGDLPGFQPALPFAMLAARGSDPPPFTLLPPTPPPRTSQIA